MKLSDIKNGEWVVLDTSILVYANQQKCPECVQLLKRCALREVRAIVPTSVVAELVQTLMLIEARENKWIESVPAGRTSNSARTLSERPELIRRLSRYENQVREFLGMGLRMEPVTHLDFLEAMNLQRQFGLLTNDALLLATARRLNCSAIASRDRIFDSVKGFVVYQPSEMEA